MTHEPLEKLIDFSWLNNKKRGILAEDTIAFAKLIIAGTIENLMMIDNVIKEHLEHWDFSRLLRVDCANLRISAYSLLFQKDIPASVTIDEAIDIAREYSDSESYRFINGVLDSIYKSLKNEIITPENE
jgi:N utilization substance protein B